MSLKPIETQAQQIIVAEEKVLQLVKLYLQMGKVQEENKKILNEIAIIDVGIEMNRKLIIEEARALLEPFMLSRRVQLHTEINYWKRIFLIEFTKGEERNFFTTKELWLNLLNAVVLAYMYGVYICNDVFETLQDYHISCFNFRHSDLDELHKENGKIISLPNLRIQLCGIDPVTFGPSAAFVNINSEKKYEEEMKERFKEQEIDQSLKEFINQINQVSADQILQGAAEGKQEVDLMFPTKPDPEPEDDEMDGMYPETFLGEISFC